MGVYMAKPVKEKISSDCENSKLKCGSSSMQGWRVTQEDAHNCCLDFDDKVSLFAVYDGHGGHEVAQYASQVFPDFLKNFHLYKNGEFENALIEAFLEFDATLRDAEVVEKLRQIASSVKEKREISVNEDDDEDASFVDEDENDLKNLKNEADMPLSEVLSNYTGLQKSMTIKRITIGESSKSPYLRAKTTSSTDAVVSSSSSEGKDVVTNGVDLNGVKEDSEVTSSSTVPNGSAVDSTSPDKAEKSSADSPSASDKAEKASADSPSGTSKEPKKSPRGTRLERMSKKRAAQIVLSSLLAGCDSEESDDSDASFKSNDPLVSSDEEDSFKANGASKDGEEDEEDDDEDEDDDDEEAIDARGGEEPGVDSGCTAVVALVTEKKLYVANAGDSRAVLCRKGVAIDMSVDHKPEDIPEMTRIQAAGGEVTNDGRVNGGLNLSRAFGDHLYKKNKDISARNQMITALPDLKIEDITPEDEFLIIACDGIWNSMSSQNVVDFVRPLLAEGEKPSKICEKLFDVCLAPDTAGDGTGCDNMTCVIVQFNPNIKYEGPKDTVKRSADESLSGQIDEQTLKKPRVDST